MHAYLKSDADLSRSLREEAEEQNDLESDSDLDHDEQEQVTLRRWGNSLALNKQGLSNNSGLTNHIDYKGSTVLSKIVMLGTHDAGTYAYSQRRAQQDPHARMNLGQLFTGAFKCQFLDLAEQAHAGARYFDVRVTKNRDVYKFFHGPSAAGNALEDVSALLMHAAQDTSNLYVFKFDLKTVEDCAFLKNVVQVSGCQKNLIRKKRKRDRIGDITLSKSIYDGKNILFMVKDTKLLDQYTASFPIKNKLRYALWSYKESVQTKWGNTISNEKLAATILNTKPTLPGMLQVTQTNKPFMNIKQPHLLLKPVKKGARQGKDEIANAVRGLKEEKGINPGVISLDYLGHGEASATETYKEMANTWNAALEMKDQ